MICALCGAPAVTVHQTRNRKRHLCAAHTPEGQGAFRERLQAACSASESETPVGQQMDGYETPDDMGDETAG